MMRKGFRAALRRTALRPHNAAATLPRPSSEPRVKIHVKTAEGELTFANWAEFQMMWKHKFIAPEDLVRRGDVDRWVRADELPELRRMATRDRTADRRLFLITLAVMTLALVVALVLRGLLLHR